MAHEQKVMLKQNKKMTKKWRRIKKNNPAVTNKKRLFGTDGIRGTANTYPMRPDLVQRVGMAMGIFCANNPASEVAENVGFNW